MKLIFKNNTDFENIFVKYVKSDWGGNEIWFKSNLLEHEQENEKQPHQPKLGI